MVYGDEVPADAVWRWDDDEAESGCEDCHQSFESYEEAEEHCETTGHAVYREIREVYVWHRPTRAPSEERPGGSR